MHELSIAMSIIEIAEETALREKASVITEIELEIGTLSGVVPEALDFAIESAKKETMLESAKWVIHLIPALAECSSCKHRFATEEFYTPCPECGQPFATILKGRELQIRNLVVE